MSSRATGAVTFASAGPGDPGLLTRRALEALAQAEHVIYDASTPEDLLASVFSAAPEEVPARATEGSPPDIAQAVITAARGGSRVVRVIHGDALSIPGILSEVESVARAGVSFEVLPGVSHIDGVASYAGTPLGAVRTLVDASDVSTLDFKAIAGAIGSVAITVDALDLAAIQAGLLDAGLPETAPLSITGEATTEIQFTAQSTLRGVTDAAVGLVGRLVITIGQAVERLVRVEGARAANKGAGGSDECSPPCLGRHPMRSSHDCGRTTPYTSTNGARSQGASRRPLRMDGLHFSKFGEGHLGEVC